MFNPGAAKDKAEGQTAKRAIRAWVQEALPEEIARNVESISVQEFQCGDPSCSPIDTGIFIMIKGGETLQQGIPKEPKDVTQAEVQRCVSEMLDPQMNMPPLGPKAAAAQNAVLTTLQAQLQGLSYGEKMGLFSHLFAAIEVFESTTVAAERQKMLANNASNNQANAILSKAQQNDAEAIEQLIAAGADPSRGNSVGQTALHVAALWGNEDAVRALVNNGAELDATNTLTGGTPLHILVSSPKSLDGRVACLRLLLAAGADISVLDGRRMTPLQVAEAGANEEPIVQLLREAEAQRSAGSAAM